MNSLITYHHTQRAPLCLLIYLSAALLLGLGWLFRHQAALQIPFVIGGGLMLLLGACFHELTVSDGGDRLLIAFGPLPLFRRSLLYDEMEKVTLGHSTFLDGWGIHYSPRGGWIWNLWGRDCVVVKLKKGMFRIGTDDPENLARFLKSRIPEDEDP